MPEKVVSGEPIPSFEELTYKLGPQLRAYLQRMVRNAAEADDLLQETLLRIARGLPGFEGRASVKNWAYRIASRVAIDFLRRARRGEVVDFDETSGEESAAGEDDGDRGDEDRLILDEMNRCVREVVESLPPIYRATLVLHHLEGRSLAETAEILGISETNAKVRISRARARLQGVLDRRCEYYATEDGTVRCDRKPGPRRG